MITSPHQIIENKERFENIFNKAVNNTLNRMFGNKGARIIYKHLENNYSIEKDEVAKKLDSFSNALEKYLDTGAAVVENEILKSIYANLSEIKQ